MPDGYEDAFASELRLFIRLVVVELDARHAGLRRAEDFAHVRVPHEVNLRILERLVLHYLRRAQRVAPVNHRHARRVARQKRSLLHRRVAAADDDDGLALEEEAVARRARRDAQAAQAVGRGGFARYAEPLRRRARSDYQSLGLYLVPLFSPEREGARGEVYFVDEGDEEVRAEALRLLLELLHEFRALNAVGEAGVIFDLCGDGELAAGLRAVYDERVEFGARGVYGRGQAGGAGAHNYYFAVQSLFRHAYVLRPSEGFVCKRDYSRGPRPLRPDCEGCAAALAVAFFSARVV